MIYTPFLIRERGRGGAAAARAAITDVPERRYSRQGFYPPQDILDSSTAATAPARPLISATGTLWRVLSTLTEP